MMQSEVVDNSWSEFCAIQKNGVSDSSLNSSGIALSDITSLFPDVSMDDLEFDDVCRWLNDSESEGNENMNMSSISSPPIFSITNKEIRLHHLLVAYAEAMENGHKELAQVIIRSIEGIINPLGQPLERVASNLFSQEDYLKQESSKNLEVVAFKVFYQIFPIGKFAHFAANSAIMESIPDDVETIHIVDFDMGEGIQWPPIIEALCLRRKALKFTSIKETKEEYSTRLVDYAKPFGLRLQIEEMTFEELASEMTRMGKGNEWLVFNCMYKLPHMGKTRCRIHALEFLKLAKEIVNSSPHRGLVIFGDGEAMDNSHNTNTNTITFSSFFNKKLIYYQSIFESMELYFPAYLAEARLAMESLFLAPQLCSFSWFQNWQDMTTTSACGETGLPGKKISKENLLQAKELVNETETPLKVRIEQQRQHQMVLEGKGTPLVRLSTWIADPQF